MAQISTNKIQKNQDWKGMDYLLTEIVKKARDNLEKRKRFLLQRANKKENNNCFLNEVTGKFINKICNR
jgi:hypothetical protein